MDVGERVLIGGNDMPPCDRPAPMGRGCGGSIVGSEGLGGYERVLSIGWRISGECDVGCWRNGMGDMRVGGVGVGRPPDCEFECAEFGEMR